MILYRINSDGYYTGTLEYPDDPENINGIPYGTTKKIVPEIPEGFYALWMGSDWTLTSVPPQPSEEII